MNDILYNGVKGNLVSEAMVFAGRSGLHLTRSDLKKCLANAHQI